MATVTDALLNALPDLKADARDHPMQVILQPLLSSEGGSVEVETNSKTVLSTLISSYCSQKGFKYDGQYTIYDEKKRPLPMYSTLSALGIENGQTLLIGKEDSSFNLLKQWPIIVALATIAIGLIGIVSISVVYTLKGGEYFDDYGVVMDAGSSKTNTIVYKWRSSKFKGTGRVSQEDSCKARGGIAKMDPMHLDPVFDCAKNVTSVIAEDSLSKTPLFFAATAGMRLLNITNSSKVNEILEKLNQELPKTGLDLRAVEIISGRDEGIYGWITSNFLLKTLELPQKLDPWESTTYGALDMGGASMQISYALPKKDVPKTSDNVKDVTLYGQTYDIFSQSNMCFGRDEADNRYHTLLLLKRNGNTIKNPCAPKGYDRTVSGKKLFEPICAKFNRSAVDTLKDLSNFEKEIFTYEGTSDPDACRKSVSDLLDENLCRRLQFKECFKKHKDLPDSQKYLAFATYFYTTSFLNITNVTLEKYEATVTDFCLKNYEEVRELSKHSPFGPQYCFNAQYIHEVLTNGFGFNKDTWKNLEFVEDIAGKEVGWTLGYMIYATNKIPEKITPRLITASALTVSIVLFIIVILATAIFLLVNCKSNINKNNSRC